MKPLRKVKVEEILHRLAAEFVVRESSLGSLITITRVELSDTAKVANLFFTTLPETEQETVLKFLQRKAPEFKLYVRGHSKLGILPELRFQIDFGERNRQKLDTLVY